MLAKAFNTQADKVIPTTAKKEKLKK